MSSDRPRCIATLVTKAGGPCHRFAQNGYRTCGIPAHRAQEPLPPPTGVLPRASEPRASEPPASEPPAARPAGSKSPAKECSSPSPRISPRQNGASGGAGVGSGAGGSPTPPSTCRKVKVLTTVRGAGVDADSLRKKVTEWLRDSNVSKRLEEVAEKQGCRHDYYLRPRVPRAAASLDVDHTFESQLLSLSVLNASPCHDVLSQIDLSAPRTRQPFVVQNLLNPIYAIHNDADINLRLLHSGLNRSKGQAVKGWVRDAVAGLDPESYSRLLERAFRPNPLFTSGEVDLDLDLDAVVRSLVHELKRIGDTYVKRVSETVDASTNSADRRKASARMEDIAAKIGDCLDDLDIGH